MKNIAIFCDGTWQNLSQRYPTNVTRLARAVTPGVRSSDQDLVQVVYYDDGVGVGEGVLNDATRLIGGGLGKGLDAKIAHAYEFLCLNYCPGDNIYIFGFSRGAYTARSLAGLLRKCWILQRKNIGAVDQAVAIYREHSKDAVETKVFKSNMCYPAEPFLAPRALETSAAMRSEASGEHWGSLRYVGVWDTVGSLGVPQALPFADALNDKYRFHDLNLSRFVLSARHAVAIDERRATFAPTLWDNIDPLNLNAQADGLPYEARPYQQAWFPGGHGAVGGGEDDGGVSISPLLWIAEGAQRAGLGLSDELIGFYREADDPAAAFPHARRTVADFALTTLGEADRGGPAKLDEISAAARTRWRKSQLAYRPEPLARFADELSA